jgi:hypothetical protein
MSYGWQAHVADAATTRVSYGWQALVAHAATTRVSYGWQARAKVVQRLLVFAAMQTVPGTLVGGSVTQCRGEHMLELLLLSQLAAQLDGIKTVDANTPVAVQIALAESAGPPVAADAAIYVIGPKGYIKARDGRNGFTCLISRQRPDTLEPECFDAVGTTSVVPVRMFVEEQRAAGTAEGRIAAMVSEGYASGRFKAPAKPGFVYMLSAHNYVFDPQRKQVIRFPGHLMFYAPYATQKDVGSGPGAPYIVAPGTPHALMIVVPRTH